MLRRYTRAAGHNSRKVVAAGVVARNKDDSGSNASGDNRPRTTVPY